MKHKSQDLTISKKVISANFTLLLIFLFIGCTQQSELILGKWKSADGQRTYEFFPDGKYNFSGPEPVLEFNDRPYYIKKNRLHMTTFTFSEVQGLQETTSSEELSIKGDTMILDGKLKYIRIKK